MHNLITFGTKSFSSTGHVFLLLKSRPFGLPPLVSVAPLLLHSHHGLRILFSRAVKFYPCPVITRQRGSKRRHRARYASVTRGERLSPSPVCTYLEIRVPLDSKLAGTQQKQRRTSASPGGEVRDRSWRRHRRRLNELVISR